MSTSEISPVGRINAILPERLAYHVGAVINSSGLYENASEFIRDLIRRHMEEAEKVAQKEINTLLLQSIQENDYSDWTESDIDALRQIAKGEK